MGEKHALSRDEKVRKIGPTTLLLLLICLKFLASCLYWHVAAKPLLFSLSPCILISPSIAPTLQRPQPQRDPSN
ncbi:hypothetical protein B0H14DRAFT_2978598, partial [Mycena olivaceomarginata]